MWIIVLLKQNSGYLKVESIRRDTLDKDVKNVAVIMEFKVFDKEDGEETMEDTARNALQQIEDKKYETGILQRGIPAERIYKYGFAFEGEKCLIRKA